MAANQEAPPRPAYGCQVLVQSEEERILRKQMRKEEKKLNRLLERTDANDDEEESELRFDPVDLRTKRQAALANAMTQPILKAAPKATAAQEVYPFVFDSLAQSKTAAGSAIVHL